MSSLLRWASGWRATAVHQLAACGASTPAWGGVRLPVRADQPRSPFWASAPRWATDVATCPMGDDLIVWAPGGFTQLTSAAAVVARFFDGTVTLAELANDLAAATGLHHEWSSQTVREVAEQLCRSDALTGVDISDLRVDADGSMSPSEVPISASGGVVEETQIPGVGKDDCVRVTEEVREDGTVLRTETLADGRRRISATMEIGGHLDFLGSLVTVNGRSPAELIPLDSCVGSKLRNHEDVPLLSFRCSDGELRSIRCHSAEVEHGLVELGCVRVHPDDRRGPIVAFVVAPLEGVGPIRIYNGNGQRHGRPRSAAEAIRVVDGLLGAYAASNTTRVLADISTLMRDDELLMVPAEWTTDIDRVRRWRRDGWQPSWASTSLDTDGELRTAAELTHPAPVSTYRNEGLDTSPRRWLSYFRLPSTIEPHRRQAILSDIVTIRDRVVHVSPATHVGDR